MSHGIRLPVGGAPQPVYETRTYDLRVGTGEIECSEHEEEVAKLLADLDAKVKLSEEIFPGDWEARVGFIHERLRVFDFEATALTDLTEEERFQLADLHNKICQAGRCLLVANTYSSAERQAEDRGLVHFMHYWILENPEKRSLACFQRDEWTKAIPKLKSEDVLARKAETKESKFTIQ